MSNANYGERICYQTYRPVRNWTKWCLWTNWVSRGIRSRRQLQLPAGSIRFLPSYLNTHIWKLPPTCQPMLSSCKRDDVTRRCFQVCCRSRRGQIARRGSGCVMSGHSTDTLVGRAESEQQSGGESRGLTGATASSLPGATQSPPLSFSTTNYLTSIIDRSYVRGRPTFIYTDRWGPSSSYSTIV